VYIDKYEKNSSQIIVKSLSSSFRSESYNIIMYEILKYNSNNIIIVIST